ncbi:MAG TPA: hypothetical protein VII56_01120 [Rhizomicrobium sp.]
MTDGVVIAFYDGCDPYLTKWHGSRADMIAASDGTATIVEQVNDRALKVLRPKLFGL